MIITVNRDGNVIGLNKIEGQNYSYKIVDTVPNDTDKRNYKYSMGNFIDLGIKEEFREKTFEELQELKLKELETFIHNKKEEGFIYNNKPFKLDAIAQNRINMLATAILADAEVFPLEWYTANGEFGTITLESVEDFRIWYANAMNKVLEIDNGASTILFSGDISRGYSAHSLGADYFITKPIGKENLERIILKIKKKIKEESIVITTGLGDRRIKLNNLNYVNIEGRCLCYHLKDGSLLDGKT